MVSRYLNVLLAGATAGCALCPTVAMAQDDGGFDFGEGEVIPIEEEPAPEPDAAPLPSALPGLEPAATTPPDDGITTVTAIAVSGDALDPATAQQVTDEMLRGLASIGGVTVAPNDALRREFEIMGPELAYECAFDPICLGRYGRQLGLDKIVVGRVVATTDGRWGATFDLFETQESAISSYRYFEADATVPALGAALDNELKVLFGIRDAKSRDVARGVEPSKWQRVSAWSALAVGVTSIGVSAVYGLQASSTQDDLEHCGHVTLSDGNEVCDITQIKAQQMIDDGEQQALVSKVFLGTGVFFGAVSALLFTLTPAGDAADEEEDEIVKRFELTPRVAADAFGFEARWRF